MMLVSRKTWIALAVAGAAVLGGCSSSAINRAPVEDRGMTARATMPTVDPATLPGAENAGKPGYYTVRQGDTIMQIARDHNTQWREIARWNNLENPNVIEVGRVLRVVPPTPVAPPPVAAVGNVGNFELGGQAAGMPAGTMQYAGMKWVKKQHKWGPGDTPDAVAGLIAEAHGAGMKILLSIPGQLYPSSIDFEAYTNFLGGVAALGPDAIEVWNEMNIEREWPIGQIDPTSYVNNMLRPAYQKIKASNPNVMVITGAPAPTGFFGGCSGAGCDDAPYVAGMMAAGAGSASDCIGVHYNEGIMPPSATSGDPRGAGGHYTRYFQGMINAYTNAGAGALCFTELGYLSGEEWGSLPAGFLWRAPYNLTVAEHAQYLAEAVRVGVQSGRVRMIIVFNVDFKTFGDDPQAGYAMIRPNGSCPACETLRQAMGG